MLGSAGGRWGTRATVAVAKMDIAQAQSIPQIQDYYGLHYYERRISRFLLHYTVYGICKSYFTGYSLSFVKKLLEYPREHPKISVSTIQLPENLTCYNTGCSLDRWAQKKPRLKSGNRKIKPSNFEVLDENAYDVSKILDTLDDLVEDDVSEVNLDIEELWRKSQRLRDSDDDAPREGDGKKCGKSCKKRVKLKLKKCINLSISKPPSPGTEQVIRVDISSTVSEGGK
ncbi:unnamed protein product [Phyllotreta striolata]|uniref:Uncharacterized protein n=1 Tax=Phyllotreta striolata TaxID=444603 RepID=A0A9N9TJB1_PHYSR|nr:unnamed protein product [Phyllotreta striolata]